MAANSAFAAALNPANPKEVRVWYLVKEGYAGMTSLSVNDLLTKRQRLQKVAHSAPKPEGAVTETVDASTSILGGGVGFGKTVTPTSVTIYGIMQDKKVCMISPTVWPLRKDDIYIVASERAVAASRAAEKFKPGNAIVDVVFFIKTPENEKPSIESVDVSNGTTKRLDDALPNADSRLCAAYFPDGDDGKDRPFVYYKRSSKLYEYDVYDQSVTPINGITSLPGTTALASCIFKGVPYLFWFSAGEYRLMYSKRKNGKWTTQAQVPGNDGGELPEPAYSQSDLDVVTTDDDQHILIFYLTNGSTNPYDYFAWMEPPQ